MKIIPVKNKIEGGKVASKMIIDLVNKKPDATLGLATGSSPESTYTELVEAFREGSVSFKKVRCVNLDEYVGLSENDEQSYHYFMWEKLFSRVDVNPDNIHIPNGNAENLDVECKRYYTIINDLGGIDLQLLGIGHNGHIGFNEPADKIIERTHKVLLAEETIKANSRFFKSESAVPKEAITMGMAEILSARRIVLLAFGYGKAEALYKALYENISPHCPASYLQKHLDFTVIADSDALSKIAL